MIRRPFSTLLCVAMLVLGAVNPALADKEKKIVLQLSDGSAEKQTLVLNVANNLQKHYGVDNIKIEVVTFNAGLRLLFKDNVNQNRIAALSQNGVRFSACEVTLKGMTKQLGRPPVLNKNAVPVAAGVARILELTEQGYTLVRP